MKIALVFGTRPEAIKMAAVAHECAKRRHAVHLIATSQHREMLDQHLQHFGITPDVDLDIMMENQDLVYVTTEVLERLSVVLKENRPEILIVQGDTTTTFASSLAAFYQHIPVGHIEAGLRTWNRDLPFPEEINRQLATRLATWHFAATGWARENLLKEHVPGDSVFVTGNPVIDVLMTTLQQGDSPALPDVDFKSHRIILVTAHRRENFGEPLERICRACLAILDAVGDAEIVYPVHPNPNVQSTVHAMLDGHPRIHLVQPLAYRPFVDLMRKSYMILSDSGGIQEEAPSLGKPVLVLRTVTERPEALAAGVAKLVGTDENRIRNEALRLLTDPSAYRAMTDMTNPFGDGKASVRIADIIESRLSPVNR